MATLYTHASQNIFKTWLLIFAFSLLVIFLGWIFSYYWQNPAILIFAVIFSVLISFVSYWNSDKIILATSHAHLVTHKENPNLYNIVENLSITAGLPAPKIYIIEDPAMNAFATGRNKKNAIIVFTRGLLSKLNKAELEGVAAHELSHVGNKDILLSSAVVVLVGLVSIASQMSLRMSFFGGRRRSDNDNNQLGTILALVSLIAAILAPIAATLLQLAISRKREFLADASGALLTRYPEGLASALEKISRDSNQLRNASPATAHLYIDNPYKGQQRTSWFVKLFSTHPPVEERVKILRKMDI
ncbi:MAG: Protease HtpX-like protein [Parcubacteria group bacterium GW2011_GWA2_39_18]|nr:MAG: Protease HtpX-like protein [Parcubacteria group bacterium GW2011_GWA2_39_18]